MNKLAEYRLAGVAQRRKFRRELLKYYADQRQRLSSLSEILHDLPPDTPMAKWIEWTCQHDTAAAEAQELFAEILRRNSAALQEAVEYLAEAHTAAELRFIAGLLDGVKLQLGRADLAMETITSACQAMQQMDRRFSISYFAFLDRAEEVRRYLKELPRRCRVPLEHEPHLTEIRDHAETVKQEYSQNHDPGSALANIQDLGSELEEFMRTLQALERTPDQVASRRAV